MSWLHELLAGSGVGVVAGLASGFSGTSPGGGLVIFSVLLLGAEQHVAQGTSLIATLFLTFLSSAYVPVSSMPSWLRPVANNQPVTALANAVRSLMLGGTDAAGVGHTTTHWVVLSLGWSVAILALFATLAVRRFSRMR